MARRRGTGLPSKYVLVLLGIGFLAGVVTAISPCVLPVLPILLAGGASGRKPFRIIAGLVASFVVFTLFATWLLDRLGLPDDLLRNIAIALLFVVAATLLVPRLALADREAVRRPHPLPGRRRRLPARRLARARLRSLRRAGARGDLRRRPRPRPRRAGRRSCCTIAYAVGAAVPMLADRARRAAARRAASRPRRAAPLRLGRRDRARRARVHVQPRHRAADGAPRLHLGAAGLDEHEHRPSTRSQRSRRAHVDPAVADDDHDARRARPGPGASSPADPRPRRRRSSPAATGSTRSRSRSRACAARSCCSTSGPTRASTACARCPTSRPGRRPTTATGSRSSASTAPSSPSSTSPRTSPAAIKRLGIRYPVVQDNNFATWTNYANEYWPADYLIDQQGRIRAYFTGEGDYGEIESDIQQLLGVSAPMTAVPDLTPTGDRRAETYLGYLRLDPTRYVGGIDRQERARRTTRQRAQGAAERDRLRRQLDDRRHGRDRRQGGDPDACTSRATTSTSSPAAAAPSPSSETATRPRPSRSPRTASTRSTPRPTTARDCSPSTSRRACRPTRSPSGRQVPGRAVAYCSPRAEDGPSPPSCSRSRRKRVSSAASVSPEGRSVSSSISSARLSSSST